ncbi:MAG: DUF523 and DUF1722 domain-containing protein [Nitrospirae bacterium]|nr:DUF523 and DUF1722 domain-containing protein [Magnetococcales bacterium]
MQESKILLGVSACLLGTPVRYDGQDKGIPWIREGLSQVFDLIAICPETQAGLGVPRPPMRLEGERQSPRMVTITTRQDMTPLLSTFCTSELRRLTPVQPCGFIFKSRSPSCGVDGVPIFNPQSTEPQTGSGLFAAAFRQAFPLAVVVEESHLLAHVIHRHHFIERMFVAHRWQRFLQEDGGGAGLVGFHARHKFQIMFHDREAMRSLGRLAANAGTPGCVADYGQGLMRALAKPATVALAVDCMMHLFGFFKKELTSQQKKTFFQLLEGYRHGERPRRDPMAWLQNQAQHDEKNYLLQQWFLFPDPCEVAAHAHIPPDNREDKASRLQNDE